MRLTEKTANGFAPKYERETKTNYYDLVSKLGEREDIEEEFGIDLPTLFKAFRNGIYAKAGREIVFVRYIGIFKRRKWHLFSADALGKYEICLVREYGKKWALTKRGLK